MCLIWDLQENISKQVRKTDYPSAGFAGHRVVDFGDLSIDISLEVQSKTYNYILHLIDYIAHGPKFPKKNRNHHEILKNLTNPGSLTRSQFEKRGL